MSKQVTHITRLHQLAEAESLLGDDRRADLWRKAAVSYGVCVLTVTARDREQRKALENALELLRSKDYEMHRTVVDTLEQARAKKDLATRMRSVSKITGNIRRRAA